MTRVIEIGFTGSHWMNITRVLEAVREASVPRVQQCALLLENEVKRSMHGGGKGRAVGQGTPSPPGTPPNVQTGNLRNGIKHAKERWGASFVVGPVRQVRYGACHEWGMRIRITPKMRRFLHHVLDIHPKATTEFVVLPKRPFMRPALMRCYSKFPQYFHGLRLRDTNAGRRLAGEARTE